MKSLIILEMANNHSGLLSHGKDIIRSYSEICRRNNDSFEFVFKFQYRHLDTFIRKDMAGDYSIPLIKRFSETKLRPDEFEELLRDCREYGFGTMVTPFDEESVDLCCSHNVDYLKIASCSFGDWPLLESIAKTGKSVVASCAGADEAVIDSVIAFFRNRNIYFILQHCVGNYPTKADEMNVGQIHFLRSKYPDIPIGFSSHEDPSTTNIAPLALALGARSFEKHVALETESITKNLYSTSPLEFERWLESLKQAQSVLGESLKRYQSSDQEVSSLRKLQRGVFAARDFSAGEVIGPGDLTYAFPPDEGQVTANDISKYTRITALTSIGKDKPIFNKEVKVVDYRSDIQAIAHEVSALVKEARVMFPDYADLEISHHYGIEKFREYGLTMITVVNREYCKKILILMPGQAHPEQYHKRKEETFHVLWGSGLIGLDGVEQAMKPGDVFIIKPGTRHYFNSQSGMVCEEISSTHYTDDSFYVDEMIHQNKDRKTFLTHWRMI